VANINRVVLVGNLTRDPELKSLPSGMSVCDLGVAVNHRRKNQQTGEWVEEPNYFTVSVFGSQGESCARFLTKGRQVAIDGRLRWRQWDAPDGTKRSTVDIVAETVQFVGPRDAGGGQGGGESGSFSGGGQERRPQAVSAPAEQGPWSGGGADMDDDIPF
jgi:single-strand DNA-binding protein